MSWFSGVVVFVLVWWTALFAVLPIGVRSAEAPPGGWRGTPERPLIAIKLAATTALAALIWLAIWLLIRSEWLSFRSGWLAPPEF